jgi:DNA-binding CsgD family transcriptional regulator
LSWVQEGKSATDIGAILGLSGRTVEKHIIKVCAHLGVKTRVQAVVRARELGLISANAP